MANVLAVVEQRDGEIRSAGHEVVSTAAEIAEAWGGQAQAFIVGGDGISDRAGDLGRFGAQVVSVVENGDLSEYQGEEYARILAEHVRSGDFRAVFFSATMEGRDLAARLAAHLDVPLAQEATAVSVKEGELSIRRPIYAGKAFARVRLTGTPTLVSLRPNVFAAEERSGAGTVERVETQVDSSAWKSRVVEFKAEGGDVPDVAEASIVVSGGRGMKDPENWHLLEELREAIGADAGLGASRAVVDAGWRPHGEQVGQTGKTVAPKLYFALGISGAIQHLAGMRTAGTIVAVNKDPEAPIFKVADYGLVGDIFEILPKLTEEIRALRSGS